MNAREWVNAICNRNNFESLISLEKLYIDTVNLPLRSFSVLLCISMTMLYFSLVFIVLALYFLSMLFHRVMYDSE